jgi:hypothetical protein
LSRRFPNHTLVKNIFEPRVRAAIELSRHNPSKALALLQTAVPFESGQGGSVIYLRGLAYLAMSRGQEAAAEFQKLIDRRVLCQRSGACAVARLQLARAKMLIGDQAGARAAYQDFLALWKDADPDVPVLKEAKAEYAKLN